MVRILGRKIMAGDVIEFPNLTDDYADISDVQMSLKRYYVVSDCSWPGEGFSPLWYPHMWRAKLSPLVDSQEYKDILTNIKQGNTNTPIVDILSQYGKYMGINDAVVEQAEADVPASGYDVSKLFTVNKKEDKPAKELNLPIETIGTPRVSGYEDYLTGDGLAPNGLPVTSGVSFPGEPEFGAYHLRVDYLPNRLFRFDGYRWIKVEDAVRTSLSHGESNTSLKSTFVNNSNTYIDEAQGVHPELQNLNSILKAKPG